MPITWELSGLLTLTIAIVVYFIGAGLNRIVGPLRAWNIPEAVTGGMLASLVTLIVYVVFHRAVVFDLDGRDMLLLYFFTGIGLNARLSDLIFGGRPLIILLALTVGYLALQNAVALGASTVLGLPAGVGPLLGSVSLIGGHGTTIAWAPLISERFHLPNALEVGIASATLGLVIASLLGGPIAGFLLSRHRLHNGMDGMAVVGLPKAGSEGDPGAAARRVTHVDLLATLLVLNIAILIGFGLEEAVAETGVKLPLFVICLLVAIVLTNVMPPILGRLAPGTPWPTRTPSLALGSDLSLNVFLVMSLLSMQ